MNRDYSIVFPVAAVVIMLILAGCCCAAWSRRCT